MSEKPIKYAVTLFSGFMQKLGSPGSGLVGLEHEIYNLCVATGRTDIRVRLYPWDTDASDVAEALWRYRPQENGKKPKQIHIVVGYSYGGDRAVKFVRQLQLRGNCSVAHLVLCDAVRRWDRLPGLAGATGLGYLQIPPVVEKCTFFRQYNPRWSFFREGGIFQPAGHPVVISPKAKTEMDGPHKKKAGHSYIDNDVEFRSVVLESVKRILRINVGGNDDG